MMDVSVIVASVLWSLALLLLASGVAKVLTETSPRMGRVASHTA